MESLRVNQTVACEATFLSFDHSGFWKRLLIAFETANAAEISRKIGLERQSLYKWREGVNQPSLDSLIAISQKTGRSLHWLLTGHGQEFIEQLPSPYASLENDEKRLVEQIAQKENQSFVQAIRSLILEALTSRGMMRKQIPPTMLVFRQDIQLIALFLIGSIEAGQPITYFKESQKVMVADVLLSQGYQSCVLEIRGDELADEGFNAGDYLICCDNKQPEDAQVAVVVVDGDRTTVKRIFFQGNNIFLQPSNGKGSGDLYAADRVEIIYTVTGVLRNP